MHDLTLPLPYMELDHNGQVVECSVLTEEIFDLRTDRFFDLVDEESRPKLERAMACDNDIQHIEVSIATRKHKLELFDLHINNTEDGHVILFSSKHKTNASYIEKIQSLQNRLSSTDFKLYEQKEALVEALNRLDRLSGPFISLTEKVGYIPLFGDITAQKTEIIAGSCLQQVFNGDYTDVLIDLTAVGEIDVQGFHALLDLCRSLKFMTGNKAVLIGIKPEHAKKWNDFDFDGLVDFNQSLQKVLEQHFHIG